MEYVSKEEVIKIVEELMLLHDEYVLEPMLNHLNQMILSREEKQDITLHQAVQ